MIRAQEVQVEHVRICECQNQSTKRRHESNPLTVLLRHRHKGLPQRDISTDVEYIPNHGIPFRPWGIWQPSISSSPMDKSQRGSDSDQCASKRRDGYHGRWGARGVGAVNSYVWPGIYSGGRKAGGRKMKVMGGKRASNPDRRS